MLVNNNVKVDGFGGAGKPSAASFAILDLGPETRYTLRITAHNAAGSTVQEYDFTTLTFLGATIAPELIIHSDYGGLIFKNPAVMLPFFLAVVVSVIIGILFAHNWRKKMHQIGESFIEIHVAS